MKIKSLIMFSIVTFVLLSNTKTLSANWYAGSQRYEANGVWANIDTPYNLDMVTIDQSGEIVQVLFCKIDQVIPKLRFN